MPTGVDYLRISITDRCNERCLYCMPEDYRDFHGREDLLSDDEIVTVVRAAVEMGFRKFRITGGEPLVRPGVVRLVGRIARVEGVESLSMTTNGARLAGRADDLRRAGLRSVNVSLDALDAALYRRITHQEVGSALEGIEAARTAGFKSVKLNAVLLRGVNESEILPIVRFGADRGLPVRFIELMPVSTSSVLSEKNFLSVREARGLLEAEDSLTPIGAEGIGHGPARYYRMDRLGAVVGFIGAMTDLHFCEGCNKVRLTADGKIRPCLGNHDERDIRGPLRGGGGIEAARAVLGEALASKPREHLFRTTYRPKRPMVGIGG